VKTDASEGGALGAVSGSLVFGAIGAGVGLILGHNTIYKFATQDSVDNK